MRRLVLLSFLALWVLSVQAGSWSGSVHVPASNMVWVTKQLPVVDTVNVKYPIVGIQTKVANVMDTTAEGFHLKVQHTLWHKDDGNQMNGVSGKNDEDIEFKTPSTFKPLELKNHWSPCEIHSVMGVDTNTRSLILGSNFKTNETLSLDVAIDTKVEESFLPLAVINSVPQNPVDYMTYLPATDGDIKVLIQKRQQGVPLISSVFASISIGCQQTPKVVDLSSVDQDTWSMTMKATGGQPVFFALSATEGSLKQPINYMFIIEEALPEPSALVSESSISAAALFTVVFGCVAFFLAAVILLVFLIRA